MKYEYLTVDNAKIGNKVVLANPNPRYSINEANPALNTRFFCCGIIKSIIRSRISVKWDNGFRNSYINNELALSKKGSIVVKTENGRYTSIW